MTDFDRRSFLSFVGAAGMQPLLSPLAAATRVPDGLWSYFAKPVQVKNPDLKDDWHIGAQYAFDGYGGSVHPHSLSHCWVQDGVPSESRPFSCTIDYGTPIAVTALVHYFYNPDVKDYRADALLLSTAFRSVNLYASRDGERWELLERWRDLPDIRPQILNVSHPTESRHYKLEVVGMTPGARGVRTYEIETYTDDSFHSIQPQRSSLQAPASPFNNVLDEQITNRGRLQNADLAMEWSLADGTPTLAITPKQGGAAIRASLYITYNDEVLRFDGRVGKESSVVFRSLRREQTLECELRLQGSAVRAKFRKYSDRRQSTTPGVLGITLKAEGVSFRFIPAYVYSSKPILDMLPEVYGEQSRSTTIGAWQAPTRMAALETKHGTLAVVPDRDRCLLGIDGDDVLVRQLLGGEAVELSLVAVSGNWFNSFLHVVETIYRFEQPRQFAPLVETATREMKYLAHNRGIWSEKMGVVTSFPYRDYVYVLYGLTYSIPALYSWYRMSGDQSALERAEASVKWMLEYPGVRVTEGPLSGAFYSQYVAQEMSGHSLFDGVVSPMVGIGGGDQADNRWVEPHATGAAVSTLLHYYVASGKQNHSALVAAKAGLDWLLRIQESNGGWIYAYHPSGDPVTDEQDAGSIWNILALWRYAQLTGEEQYRQAAERGRDWFAQKFLSQHIGRGYWEDVSGARGRVRLSWESYELALAASVFDEMSASDLALEAAKNAITWIWTRTIACRDYFNSYGHAHEQWGWPPATYVAPTFGVAAQIAYRISGDERFHRFAGAAKTPGWWVVRNTPSGIWPAEANSEELGAAIWPLEATEFVPLEEPFTITYWVDWISAQQCFVGLRWLLNEVSLRTGGKVQVDPASMSGSVLGDPGEIYLHPEEMAIHSTHAQINWLGYRSAQADTLVILNDGDRATVEIQFRRATMGSAKILHTNDGKQWSSEGSPSTSNFSIQVGAKGCAIVVRHR